MAYGKATPFMLLVGAMAVLVAAVALVVRTQPAGDPFRLEQAVICLEVTDEMKPISISNQFPLGSRQVCLWFRYSLSRDDYEATIKWFREGGLIYKETLSVPKGKGVRAFYLLREDGSQLPAGKYIVRMDLNGRKVSELPFGIF